MSSDKIKERIRRLLAVAKDGSNAYEQEIDTALRMVNKLMQDHHLSEADLSTEPACQYEQAKKAWNIVRKVPVGAKIFLWETLLREFVEKFVGGIYVYREFEATICRIDGIAQLKNGQPMLVQHYVFNGAHQDVNLAADLFVELRQTILAMAQLRWGGAYKGDGGRYCEGFVAGLKTKIVEMDKAQRIEAVNNSTALVLIDRRNDLIKFKTNLSKQFAETAANTKFRNITMGGGARGSESAFNEGKSDGSRYEVSRNKTAKLN